MLLKTVYVTARDRVRLKAIGQVLFNYGLQDLIRILGLNTLFGRRPVSDTVPENQPQRLRQALEALGPTFVKLGQILATRADLFDESWTSELEKLHSNVTVVPWEQICHRISDALGAQPEEVFAEFDRTPLASASMAQVYRARLHSGEEVVVKVLKPGLKETIDADLRLMAWLAELIEQQSPDLARFHPRQLVRQLATAMHNELDLTQEAKNTLRFRENFRDRPDIVIPRLWPEYSTEHLIVQSYIPGTPPQSQRQLAEAGFDGPTLARKGALAFMQMVFLDRLYHADPHAGNLMAVGDNQVAFIDFGMAGQISERRCNQLLLMMQALSERESEGLVNTLICWSEDAGPDCSTLELAVQDFYQRVGPGELPLGHALVTILAVAREYQLSLPSDLVLLFKALITADGVLRRIDPNIDIIGTLTPFLQETMLKHYGAGASGRRLKRLGIEMVEVCEELPQTLSLVLRRLQHGKLHADLEVKNLNDLGRSLERSAMTLAVAIVTAAFALGLALWLLATNFTLFGIPLFPLLCLGAVGTGIFLLTLRLRP